MTTLSMGRTFLAGFGAMALLALAGGAQADEIGTRLDSVMRQEIETAHARLQKATENIGCLVTATGTNEPALVLILDKLNDGEVTLREARRLAQAADTDEERSAAIEQARASLVFVQEAEAFTLEPATN